METLSSENIAPAPPQPSGALAKVRLVWDHLVDWAAIAAGLIAVAATLMVTIDVAARYFFDAPVEWAFEITEVTLVWFTFLAAPWVLKRDGHVRVDIVFDHLSPMTKVLLNIFTSAISAVVCLVFTYYGAQITVDYIQRGVYIKSTLQLPLYLFTWVVPVGCSLLFVGLLLKIHTHLKSWLELKRQASMHCEESV